MIALLIIMGIAWSVMDYTGYDRGYWNHYIWKVIRDCLIKIKVKLFEKK